MLKKILYGICGIILCTSAFAWDKCFPADFTPGYYIGVDVGWGKADIGSGMRETLNKLYTEDAAFGPSKNIDEGGWPCGRAYLGYAFNPYISVEAGGSYYIRNGYGGDSDGGIPYSFNLAQRTFTIDLVGKLTFPLGKLDPILAKWSVFGRAGGAYVYSQMSGTLSIGNSELNNWELREQIAPTFGLGLVYDITNNISANATWMTVLGNGLLSSKEIFSGNFSTPIPRCNLYALGLSYKFINLL